MQMSRGSLQKARSDVTSQSGSRHAERETDGESERILRRANARRRKAREERTALIEGEEETERERRRSGC